MLYELTDHFVVSADLNATWDLFSRAENLADVTPPWMNFTVDTPRPIHMREDAVLDYTIRWMHLPMHWRTRIIDWTPPRQFIDLQLKGPYTLWHHQHTFTPSNEGTICRDRVLYKLPVPLAGRVMHAVLIKRQLLGIFRYRREAISKRLGWVRAIQPDVQIKRI